MTDWGYTGWDGFTKAGKKAYQDAIYEEDCRHVWLDAFDENNQRLGYQICANCGAMRGR